MRIFHLLPLNLDPSGGIKVHYQLSSLERQLGYESFIVYDHIVQVPDWFNYTGITHIAEARMHAIANKNHDLIIGYENIEPLFRSGFKHKVCYVQGEVFVQRNQSYTGMDIWISSDFNKAMLPQFNDRRVYMVSPYIDKNVFYYDKKNDKRDIDVLIQNRKAGEEAKNKILAADTIYDGDPEFVKYLNNIKVLNDCKESEFADMLRRSKVFINHSYPEGLGLCGLEAMACGCVVAGFTGGGGTDYMTHGVNSFVATPDGNYEMLAVWLNWLFTLDKNSIEDLRNEADKTVAVYSKQRTTKQLQDALAVYEERE